MRRASGYPWYGVNRSGSVTCTVVGIAGKPYTRTDNVSLGECGVAQGKREHSVSEDDLKSSKLR
jgi:hypothetical protein